MTSPTIAPLGASTLPVSDDVDLLALLDDEAALQRRLEHFERSQERFGLLLRTAASSKTMELEHGELEDLFMSEGRELMRQVLQDQLDLRAESEQRVSDVVDADWVRRTWAEEGRSRPLQTVLGTVQATRFAYRARGASSLHPADARLNLPDEKYSHGLRRMCAIEAARGSFDEAGEAVRRATDQSVPTRQRQALAQRAAVDFDDYYATREREPVAITDALVGTCDGKGVVMRPDSLREETRKRAQQHQNKLKTRLSRGEKANRKRMAELASVYDAPPAPRSIDDIMPIGDPRESPNPAPVAKNKWCTASVKEDAATVIAAMFDEMQRRDPAHARDWVALTDGNKHQLDCVKAEAARRDATITIVLDFVHVIEYLWKAAWCLHAEGDPAAEVWVRDHGRQILAGNAAHVARSIKREAARAELSDNKRSTIDTCVGYLINNSQYLDYPTALRNGWPIATGVIEGACRHIVKDRMDITGARWGLKGAEAVLKLRALHANGDFDEYWRYHLARERERIHQSRYANSKIPHY